jgi:hypothetical protein
MRVDDKPIIRPKEKSLEKFEEKPILKSEIKLLEPLEKMNLSPDTRYNLLTPI